MKNLIIGNSSQLSYYFPDNYEKIPSRNIDIKKIHNEYYNKVFLTFAEQRTYLNESLEFFTKTNVDYTISIIDEILDSCNSIVIFSTAELWNNYDRCINIHDSYNYNYTHYIRSKEILCNHIRSYQKYNKVIIIYPFNFNSTYRRGDFLFSKIYTSIQKKIPIVLGNINFYRDITHPQIIVDECIESNNDMIIGSGFLINLEHFIHDMYDRLNMNFNEYVKIEKNIGPINTRKNYYSCYETSTYDELLDMYTKNII